jgi:uncharacterized membrane protein (TIGR02234 family)
VSLPEQPVPSAADTRREYGLVLAIGAVGAVVILLALREVWAHAIYTPPHPIPAQDYALTGQSLIPLASALAVAALACLAAVIATRRLARRVVGLLLAIIGAYAAVTVTASVTSSAVLAAALPSGQNADAATGAGSTTSGAASGSVGGVLVSGAPGHAVFTGLEWHVVAVAGAVAIVLAGLATLWRGPTWPVMSARFERPDRSAAAKATNSADSATMWESLSRDVDPTAGADLGAGADLDMVDLGPSAEPGSR